MSLIEKFDWVSPLNLSGKIILTSFPGLSEEKIFCKKTFLSALRVLEHMRCKVLLSLVEDIEFSNVCDKNFFVETINHMGFEWYHLPIQDYDVPDEIFFKEWRYLSPKLQVYLSEGTNIGIHCMGGLGRSGTVASLLLIELGESNSTVIHRVRERRKGAIENELQENFIKDYNLSQ